MSAAVPGSGSGSRSAVVVLSRRLGQVLPAAALAVLREAAVVYADLPEPFDGAVPVPSVDTLAAQAAAEPVVLLTLDAASGPARVLSAAGALVISMAEPRGAALLDAVAVMDRLRSPGGCPWDAEQTHASLRRYLIEEAYELLDAIEHGDREALREELGDVLLQVLFHARIAAEGSGSGSGSGGGAPQAAAPFDVDDVAATLVEKLVSRHPHVFAGSERLATAADQEVRWEQLKRDEKKRSSALDGVALGQPAAALAAKLVSRARRAGLPDELLPGADGADGANGGPPSTEADAGPGAALFAVAAHATVAGHDPESELRAAALRFAALVRAAENAARAAGLDPAALPPDAWRRFLP
jgi:NTP pyrophosphatase (non-canonical NTP hydrolase)